MLRPLVTLSRRRLRVVLSVLLVLAFCVPAIVAGLGFYQFTRVSVTEEVESGLALLAEFKAVQVHDWLAQRVFDAGTIVRLGTVQAQVARVIAGGDSALDSLWVTLELEWSTYSNSHLAITVCRIDGTDIVPQSLHMRIDREAFSAAVAGKRTVSTMKMGSGMDDSMMEIYAPLTNPEGTRGAVMIAHFSPQQILEIAGNGPVSSTAHAHLVDSTGRILNSTRAKARTSAAVPPGGDSAASLTYFHYRDERGIEVVGIQRAIPGLGWKLLIERDHDEAFRHLLQLREILWKILGVIIVLAGIIAVAAANYAVGRLDRRERELRTTHQQLITADRLASVGMMAASVAHEINNPLTTIKVLIHSLREHLSHKDTRRKDLGIVLAEIDKIKAIVLRFLQFARPREPEFASVDLSDTLTRIVALIGPQALTKGLALTESYKENTRPVWADAAQIGQVFLNILLNAVDATPPRGGIRVTIAPGEDKTVEVDIWNSGPGLPAELEERIFEPFFSTKPTGTGLGLSIARTIVGKHRGTIRAKGHGDGGTNFIISLRTSEQE